MKHQTLLLRVLEHNEPTAGERGAPQHFDVRIITATNRDIEASVGNGTFRKDLYHRLSAFPIHVPPLRSRPEDVPALAYTFLEQHVKHSGSEITEIPQTEMARLVTYQWPGNIRELSNVIGRAVLLCSGPTLSLGSALPAMTPLCQTRYKPGTLPSMEQTLIATALRDCKGVIDGPHGAANQLSIPPSTLRVKIKRYGLERPASHNH